MYKSRIKLKVLVFFVSIILILGQSQTFSYNLVDEIYSRYNKQLKEWVNDKNMETVYSSEYSQYPYEDALYEEKYLYIQNMLSGAQYVNDIIVANSCTLSQKKTCWILYYFVPEFRAEISRNLKLELGDTDEQNFEISENEVMQYCTDYYQSCVWNDGNSTKKTTASMPKDVKTNCKEFFVNNYKVGYSNAEKIQKLQQVGLKADTFMNWTNDDGTHDIMFDIWNITLLIFKEALTPITPVMYHLPIFEKSEKELLTLKNWTTTWSTNLDTNVWWNVWWTNWNLGTNNSGTTEDSSNPNPLSRWSASFFSEWWFDDLVAWLWTNSVKTNSTNYGNLCDQEKSESEIQEKIETRWIESDLSDLSDEEKQELVDFMLDAVDKYGKMSEDKENKIKDEVWDVSKHSFADTPDELENAAEEIKSCWKNKCEWLKWDEKVSCMIMCSCWEYKPEIFDTEKYPDLWPIFMVRWCAIPWVDRSFSVWWTNIVSIEEWVHEIRGVVGKLSEEWKLWTWTQQRNFLDSTTKNMNFANAFSFSINIDWIDIGKRSSTHTTQYRNQTAKLKNRSRKAGLGISNNLDNPATKNNYVVGARWQSKDYSQSVNSEIVVKEKSALDVAPSTLWDVNLNADARASLRVAITDNLNTWMDQQAELWKVMWENIEQLDEYAQALYAKK